MLANASHAIIVGFNVRPDPTAKANAERDGVEIRLYRIIYDAIEEIEAAMKGMLAPKFREAIIGHAEVRQTYKVSAIGTIAGCYVKDGKITREQLATMLYRYAQSRGLVKADVQGDLSAFTDSASVSLYAVEAMRWAVAAGIVNGMDGSLVPQGEATRAQMATMLMRYAKLAA